MANRSNITDCSRSLANRKCLAVALYPFISFPPNRTPAGRTINRFIKLTAPTDAATIVWTPDVRDHETADEADGEHPETGRAAGVHIQAPLALHAGHHAPVVDHVRSGKQFAIFVVATLLVRRKTPPVSVTVGDPREGFHSSEGVPVLSNPRRTTHQPYLCFVFCHLEG